MRETVIEVHTGSANDLVQNSNQTVLTFFQRSEGGGERGDGGLRDGVGPPVHERLGEERLREVLLHLRLHLAPLVQARVGVLQLWVDRCIQSQLGGVKLKLKS